jgi:hypothetical protein
VLILVPIVLRLSSNYLSRNYCHSLIDFDVGRKYYFFQVFVVFFFVTIIGAANGGTDKDLNLDQFAATYRSNPDQAVLDARNAAVQLQPQDGGEWEVIKFMKQIKSQPDTIPGILGTAIPQQVRALFPLVPNQSDLAAGAHSTLAVPSIKLPGPENSGSIADTPNN